ncbi:MAG: hypothetical protein IJK64_00490 [Clostridia bacterium]|nr:hypothetical protein [Clostridia bacterium]
MSKKNILTGVVVALALVLVGVVVLVKTGVISRGGRGSNGEENDTVIESSVVLMSDVNEDGDTFYYTMVEYYARPRVSSNHTYPTTKPKETSTVFTEETEIIDYVELTSVVQLSDENGNPLFDENGEPITEVVTYTMRADETTTETTTAYVQRTSVVPKTDIFHRDLTDANGNPVTELIYIDPPSSAAPTTLEGDTSAPTTEEVTTTNRNVLPTIPKADRQDALADSVADQINASRTAAGLAPLEKNSDLTNSARTGSLASAMPEVYGSRGVKGDVYRFQTTYGGTGLANQVISGASASAMSADKTKIGVAVVKYKDIYYTTVIFG